MRGAAAQLYREVDPEPRQYRDRRFPGSDEEYYQALATSKTVGFCSFVISITSRVHVRRLGRGGEGAGD